MNVFSKCDIEFNLRSLSRKPPCMGVRSNGEKHVLVLRKLPSPLTQVGFWMLAPGLQAGGCAWCSSPELCKKVRTGLE